MTKESAPDYLPLVTALAEGKTIEVLDGQNEWKVHDNLKWDQPADTYRVKPDEPAHVKSAGQVAYECYHSQEKAGPLISFDAIAAEVIAFHEANKPRVNPPTISIVNTPAEVFAEPIAEWRDLEVLIDTWQEGDEFESTPGKWEPTIMRNLTVRSDHAKGRRRVAPKLPNEAQTWQDGDRYTDDKGVERAPLPAGYHLATEAELECLPEGSLIWYANIKEWRPSKRVGEPAATWDTKNSKIICPNLPEWTPPVASDLVALEAGDIEPGSVFRAKHRSVDAMWFTPLGITGEGVAIQNQILFPWETLMEHYEIKRPNSEGWSACSKPKTP